MYSVRTHTEYANSVPRVSGPRVLGPWYSGPLNIVSPVHKHTVYANSGPWVLGPRSSGPLNIAFLTTRSQSLKKQKQNQNYS